MIIFFLDLFYIKVLALSATIGNFENFYSWMKRIEDSKKRRLYGIQHHERYNDLKPYLFGFNNEGKLSLLSINPCFALKIQNKQLSFPPDMKLLSDHCIEIYEQLKEKLDKETIKYLDPNVFFDYLKEKKTWNISMKDIAKYEIEIKNSLIKIFEKNPEIIKEVIKNFKEKIESDKKNCSIQSYEYLQKNLKTLLKTLEKEDMLPAIVFHFEDCEKLAEKLCNDLIEGKYYN